MSGKKSKQKAQKEHKENTRACVSPSFSGQGRVRKYARGHYITANAKHPSAGCSALSGRAVEGKDKIADIPLFLLLQLTDMPSRGIKTLSSSI